MISIPGIATSPMIKDKGAAGCDAMTDAMKTIAGNQKIFSKGFNPGPYTTISVFSAETSSSRFSFHSTIKLLRPSPVRMVM